MKIRDIKIGEHFKFTPSNSWSYVKISDNKSLRTLCLKQPFMIGSILSGGKQSPWPIVLLERVNISLDNISRHIK